MTQEKEPMIFPNLSIKDREQHIKNNCYTTEKRSVKSKFSEEKLAKIKDNFANLKIEVLELEQTIDEKTELIIKPLKDKIKNLETSADELLEMFKKKYEIIEMDGYGFPDHKNKLMKFYSEEGHWIGTRPLDEAESNQPKVTFKIESHNESGSIAKTA